MTLNQTEQRSMLAAKIFHDLAVNRRVLPVVSEDGSRPIVVALDEELLSVVVGRVRKCGGSANLFIEMEDGEVVLMSVLDKPSATATFEVFSNKPMHVNTTIGMMAEYVSSAPDGVQIIVKLPKLDADVRYVERREMVDA